MHTQRGFIGTGVLIAIVLVLLVVGGGVYFVMHQSPSQTASENYPDLSTTQQKLTHNQTENTLVARPTGTTQSANQSQLAMDLSKITPQFITADTAISADLGKIKADVKSILLPNEQNDSQVDIALNVVGKRYVVATVLRPTDAGSHPQIVDSVTLKSSNYIPGLYQFTIGKTQVYVSATDICTYTLDASSCVPLQGAKLSGGELYGDDQTMASYFVPQDLTHTNTSMTIAVLAWVNPYTNQAKLQKVRDVTLAMPGASLPTSNSGSSNSTSEFSLTPTSGPTPLTVKTSSIDDCQFNTIDWGDGSAVWNSYNAQRTCEVQNPLLDTASHTYTVPGQYTVTLKSPSGTILSSTSINITSSFSVSPASGKVPLSVTTASFDGCNSQLTWGDNTDTWYSGYAMQSCGAGATHPVITKTHTYTAPGGYTVSLYLNPPPANPISTATVTVTQ